MRCRAQAVSSVTYAPDAKDESRACLQSLRERSIVDGSASFSFAGAGEDVARCSKVTFDGDQDTLNLIRMLGKHTEITREPFVEIGSIQTKKRYLGSDRELQVAVRTTWRVIRLHPYLRLAESQYA
jgi:hypothetical protein